MEKFQFKILYFLGILSIVGIHCGIDVFSFINNIFNVRLSVLCLFIFTSGYFFASKESYDLKDFLIKKIKKIIIPLFIWNLIYGLLFIVLRHYNLFNGNAELNFDTLILAPMYSCHKFVFNSSAWFLFPLFLTEVFSILIIPHFKSKHNEYLIFVFYTLLGALGLKLFLAGYDTKWWVLLMRFSYFLPFFALGFLYQRKLEKKDNCNNTMYFSIVILAQIILLSINNATFNYGPAWGIGFKDFVTPILFGFVGIAFWYRLAKILVPSLKNSRFVKFISKNTSSIMMHHLFGFYLLNLIIYVLFENINIINTFNENQFKSDIFYLYIPDGIEYFRILYLFFSISVALFISKMEKKIIHILKKLFNFIGGRSMKFYNKKIETMSQKKMAELQIERLQNIVDYCIKNIPYYKKKLKKVGIKSGKQIETLSDISKIPFTTRDELKNNYPKGFLAVPMKKIARVHASSGTTGKPKLGYYTKKDLDTWSEAAARVLVLNGITKNDILQISVGYGLFTGALGFHQGAEKIGCSIVPASAGNSDKQLVMMHDVGVTAIMATPSYAMQLSELIKQSAFPKSEYKIKKVLLGAERCTNSMKKMIQNNFGYVPADNYGLTEFFGPGVAGECEYHDGLHINEDLFYPEIIDIKTGEVLPEGSEGELVFTALYSEAMPLLRYKTGDITSLNREKCKCGRTLVRMKAPYARTDDMFVFKGVNIYPTQVEYVLSSIDEITPYYLIKLERNNYKDKATLYIELPKTIKSYSKKTIEDLYLKITKELLKVIVVKIDVKLVDPNTLERFTGKSKRVEDLRYNKN